MTRSAPSMPPEAATRSPCRASELGFTEVFTAHAPQVIGLLRRLGVREADVQDVAQEVFVAVHRNLPAFEGRSSLRTWIYGIATRQAANHRRRAHVRRERLSVAPEAALQPVEVSIATTASSVTHLRGDLLGALDQLDPKLRDVFVLYDVEGLSMAEVAELVGCPRFTGYTRLRTARKAMRALLSRLGYGRSHAKQ